MLSLQIRKTVTKLLAEFLSSSFYIKTASSLASLPVQIEHTKNSARMVRTSLQGVLNSRTIPYHLHRSWPYWVYQQTNPKSPFYTHSGFPALFLNTTQRNWTTLSSPGTTDKVTIDPRGLITPYLLGWSLDFWIAVNQQLVQPALLPAIHQQLSSHTLETSYVHAPIEVKSEAFFKAEPDHNHSLLFNKVTLKNLSDSTHTFSFFFAIRPFNPEGISPIQDITYLSSHAFVVDNRLGLVLDQKPDNIICMPFEDGDVSEQFNSWHMILKTKCQHHLASAFAEYKLTLNPGESKTFSCKLPTHPASRLKGLFQKSLPLPQAQLLSHQVQHIQAIGYEEAKLQVQSDWEALFKNYAKTQIPVAETTTLINQLMGHLHSFIDRKPLSGTQFSDKSARIHDTAYLILALNRMGAFEMSKKILKSSRFFQKTRFYPYLRGDRTGQLLVALWDTYQYSHDIGFLQAQFPQVESLVKKIKAHGHGWTNTSHVALELKHFINRQTGKEVYFFDYFWALAGLKAGASIAEALKREEAHDFQKLVKEFESSLEVLLRDALGPLPKYEFIPVSTKRSIDTGLMLSLASVYPLQVLDPFDPRINQTLQLLQPYMTENRLLSLIGTPGFSITNNCQLAQIAMLTQQDKKALDLFDWLSRQSLSTGAFPEAIHPLSGGGSSGEGHSMISSAALYLLIRNMLLQESADTLVLFPCIPTSWFGENSLSIEQWPTRFGPISVSVKKVQNQAHLSLIVPTHPGLKRIQVYLPVPYPTHMQDLSPVSQDIVLSLGA